ncbi:hypothetical protein PINS_up002202 [Pythium insidiosum]|nr:hypothetical protein PINS_up002202 [Pythium insidiosum]
MKFGKVLQQSMQVSSPAWESFWVDYKLLKKIIKDCAQIQKEEKLDGSNLIKTKIKPNAKEDNDSIRTSPDEMNFFRTLRSEIKKIGDFFVREQGAYISRVKAIEEQYMQLQSDPRPETKTELMKACVSLYKELLLLENFAVMNFCGISKILKKHDKWTGYATRNKFMRTILMKQPFATYLPLLQMIDRLEHIFMEATGSSIDQHDSRRRGGESRPNMDRSLQHHSPSLSAAAATTSPSSSSALATDGSPGAVSSRSNSPTTRAMSPQSSDEGVSLGRVHALRDDARHFRQAEGVDDCYDGDEDGDGESGDDQETTAREHQSPERAVSAAESLPQQQISPLPEPPQPQPTALRKEYHSDSDAAAIAMLSMKEGMLHGSDSEGPTRYKRKACSPLTSSMGPNGKRKMSFATILN